MNIFSPMIEEQIKKDFHISEPILRDAMPSCTWWKISVGHFSMSIYYDPDDSLGYVGVPYYELYDGDETYRYLSSDDPMDLILELHKQKVIYEESYSKDPEKWLWNI